MSAPYEIIAAPLTLYLADVDTAFPDVDTTPGAGWTKIGTSGDKNYSEDGVKVSHSQTLATFTPAGGTGPRKVWRTNEELLFELTLVDLDIDQWAKVLNDQTVSTVVAGAGTPGYKHFPLQQGLAVAQFALLARGTSTEDDTLAAQFEVDIAYQAANPEPVFKKGEPAGLLLQFAALEDATNGFGRLVVQTDPAS